MDDTLKSKILELLNHHRLITVATNRPDGWPQATTVGYVNDGLTIYFLSSPPTPALSQRSCRSTAKAWPSSSTKARCGTL
jgi:hypothetical protein